MDKRMCLPNINECTVIIIGLGYVGLPLAVEFGKKNAISLKSGYINRKIIGFDINKRRIEELKNKFDKTLELSSSDFENTKNLTFTNNKEILKEGDIFIISVPTPIDSHQKPNLEMLTSASELVGHSIGERYISKSNTYPVIIYESTVYPGLTEEICVKILESKSKLKFNKDFFCGYSPERINPGDKQRKITNITKITSGSTIESAKLIDNLYKSIIDAGTFMASSIKVAEAAKVIENTQRDINIALMNELSMIFNKLNIDTLDVLKAAETKWNFLPFKPGLVGGHCIGVDPYYLTYKAESIGIKPNIILSGRKINDNMPRFIADLIISKAKEKNINLQGCNTLILGLTFKENCPDLRNSKVFDLIDNLKKQKINLDVVDPYVIVNETQTYDFNIDNKINFENKYSLIIAAVSHNSFADIDSNKWEKILNKERIIVDIKGFLPKSLKPIRI